MLKRILLASCVLVSGLQAVVPVDWQVNAARLAAKIANFPAKFQADTVLYNETVERLHLVSVLFSDEIDNVNTVFTCLREKYAALKANYNQVLVDTEISIEDAALKKLLLQGELQDLIEETDATIARLTSERDALTAERNVLQANYDELVGEAGEIADDLMLKIADVLSSYNIMVAAKSNMVNKLDEFNADIRSLFTNIDAAATTASNEICPPAV